ncbi:MAG: ATP-dependent helicase [Gilliamella sp.]|uniref:UvrD-helicase domain-containing protein n=1 Tax=Gilliamella sp. TaxID=1891236 RepID=UPI0025F35D92|nr:UvrD-helicase domain-containing protein [Gilliamella sp.]MCO6545589.1 ATP-dependent helicase [Gilliamella sp.]MCO6548016.1 ATP-dependent helicase [Gilliamella sp.]
MTLEKNLEKDHLVQEKIFNAINEFNSFRVNAGAGAGKTYALIESMKYILSSKQSELRKNNQKIICITYTNVAVNEIKARLGNTQFVLVSTIHEMLWEQIKLYQKSELIDLQKEKINKELSNIQEQISEYKEDNNLSIIFGNNLASFLSMIKETKDLFYNNKDKDSNKFKSCYSDYITKHDYLCNALKNVHKFKTLVKLFYKEDSYKKALARISDSIKRKNIKIQYDSKSNSDRLTSMKFSHDTLLEYSYLLVDRYPMLRRIIIDKYPYIFIDEYQDTHENVIKLVQKLHLYAQESNKKWMVGYFGDTKQNIYDDGIGSNIQTIHSNIINIDKRFNRRAHLQLIDLINNIRNDSIKQEPIDPNRINGNIQFFHLQNLDENNRTSKIQEFIEQFKNSIPQDQKIDCLVPVNRSLANLSGFEAVYKTIKNSNIIKYKDFNSQFLSHQFEKLHSAVLIFYYLVMFYKRLKNRNTTYYELLGKTNNDITFVSAKKAINLLTNICVTTLEELLRNMSCIIQENDSDDINLVFQYCFNNCLSINYADIRRYGSFYEYMKEVLYTNMFEDNDKNEETVDENNKKIQEILNVDLTQWLNWVSFINEERDEDSKVIYHTYHGTKGTEYDNVAIIMEHNFGGISNGRDKFKNYFSYIQSSPEEKNQKSLDKKYKEQLENTQNLIYVACSRAKKNLRVLYLDDISGIESGIKLLFNDIHQFN